MKPTFEQAIPQTTKQQRYTPEEIARGGWYYPPDLSEPVEQERKASPSAKDKKRARDRAWDATHPDRKREQTRQAMARWRARNPRTDAERARDRERKRKRRSKNVSVADHTEQATA